MNDTRNKIVELNLNDILPNRFQPRIQFNEEAIIGLSDSIREHGVLEPIIVRPIGDKYEIVAGERRYKACVLANLETIPARIIDMSDHDSVEIALIENVQRRDLTPIEEALSYNRILDMGYLTQEQLARKLGKSQSTIANKKRLLNLCDEVQSALVEEKISERHARSLLKLSNANAQKRMLNRIIDERLTVRRLDEEIEKELALMTPEEQLEEVANALLNVEDDVQEDSIIDISNLFDDDIKPIESLDKPTTSMSSSPAISEINTNVSNNIESAPTPTLETSINPASAPMNSETESVPTPSPHIEPLPSLMPTIHQFVETIAPESMDNPIMTNETTTSISPTPEMPVVEPSPMTMAPELTSEPITNDVSSPSITEVNRFNKFIAPEYKNEDPDNKLDPLIAPVIENPNGTSEPSVEPIAPPDNLTPTTMFSNLMNNNPVQESENVPINQDDLNNFLDPSIIDGQKQEVPENIDIIDASVFARFLDPDYDINSIDNEEKEEVKPMSFAQYLNNDNSNDQVQTTPMTPSPSAPDMLAPQGTPSSMPDMLAPQSQPSAPTGFDMPKPDLMATMDSNYNPTAMPQAPAVPDMLAPAETQAPDMLAPQEIPSPMPDMLAPQSQPSAPTGFDMPKPDLMATMDSNYNPTAMPQAPAVPDMLAPAETQAPDMLAPQEIPSPMPDMLAPQSAQQSLNPSMGVGGSTLTPDTSFGLAPEVETPTETPLTESYQVPQETNQPGFVMATSDQPNYNMPSTPVMDTNTNALFQPPAPEEQAPVETPAPVVDLPPAETEITAEPTDEDISRSQAEIQPIIVTDYEKQYDPLLPDNPANMEPKVDLRQVIDMIRSLSNQIEDLGFKIDTEEVDFDDSYKVTFVIEK